MRTSFHTDTFEGEQGR